MTPQITPLEKIPPDLANHCILSLVLMQGLVSHLKDTCRMLNSHQKLQHFLKLS